MRELIHHAATIGAHVHFAHLDDDPNLLGYYSPKYKQVVIRLGMTRPQTRWVFGHELGHAHYNHQCSGIGAQDRAERQADAYAARLLIDPTEFARLERINPDPHWLAEEFDVHVDAIHAYQAHCLTRLTGVTYARAKMGTHQWAHKTVMA